MSKTTKIVLSVIAIAFIGYAGWWMVAFNGNVNNSSVVPTLPKNNDVVSTIENQTLVANWKTYKNATMGFEIKYPASWYVEETSDSVHFSNVKVFSELGNENVKNESYVGIRIEGGNGQLPIKNWFEKSVAFVMEPKSVEFVTVGGHPAVRAKPSEGIGERLNYYITSGDDVVEVTFPMDVEKFIQTYEQMLSTFKFLK
jgi:hypothetical protein